MTNPEPAISHILLSLPDSLPDEAVAQIVADFDLPKSLLKVRKREREIFAAFEWTIPTSFFVFLGSAVLTELIKEASKEYSPKVISGIKALARRCWALRVRWVSSASTPDKLDSNYPHSAGFSLIL